MSDLSRKQTTANQVLDALRTSAFAEDFDPNDDPTSLQSTATLVAYLAKQLSDAGHPTRPTELVQVLSTIAVAGEPITEIMDELIRRDWQFRNLTPLETGAGK